MFDRIFRAFKGKANESKHNTNDKYKTMTVKFDSKRITPKIQKIILNSVNDIPEIDKKYKKQIGEAFIQGEKDGGNLGLMMQALTEIGLENKLAHILVRTVHNQVRAFLNLRKQQELGYTEAYWKASGVPCFNFTHYPSEEQLLLRDLHQKANGERFRLDQGLLINGEYQYPGDRFGCRCYWHAIMPGFDE